MFHIKSLSFYLIRNRIPSPNFYEDEDLFKLIINERKSLARFGDGEIQWMFNVAKGYFGQHNNKDLALELNNIIISEDESLIVCIPSFFNDMDDYSRNRILSRNTHLFSNYQK